MEDRCKSKERERFVKSNHSLDDSDSTEYDRGQCCNEEHDTDVWV